MPHAARVGEDHRLEQRTALLHQEELVDLLLVFGHGVAHLGVVENERHLLGDRILVDRHRHSAQRLGRRDRPIEPRPVIADDRELVAAAEPHRGKSAGERLDLGGDLGPAPALPDAVILLAVRRTIGPEPRMLEQKLWERVQRDGPLGGRTVTNRRGDAERHRCSRARSATSPCFSCAGAAQVTGSPPLGQAHFTYRAASATVVAPNPGSRDENIRNSLWHRQLAGRRAARRCGGEPERHAPDRHLAGRDRRGRRRHRCHLFRRRADRHLEERGRRARRLAGRGGPAAGRGGRREIARRRRIGGTGRHLPLGIVGARHGAVGHPRQGAEPAAMEAARRGARAGSHLCERRADARAFARPGGGRRGAP